MRLESLELDVPILLAAAFSLRQAGLLAAVAAVCALLLVSQRRRARDREPSTSGYVRELRSQIREQGEHQRETAELAIDLEEIARRITSEVDTRFVKLETVIRHADERIEHLERLLRSGGNSTGEWTVDDQSGQGGRPDAGEDSDSQAKVIALADAGLGELDIARRLKLPSAEVELILSMRRARTGAASSGRNSIA